MLQDLPGSLALGAGTEAIDLRPDQVAIVQNCRLRSRCSYSSGCDGYHGWPSGRPSVWTSKDLLV